MIGYVDSEHRREGSQREPNEERAYETLMIRLRDQLPEETVKELLAEGAALTEDQAVEEALNPAVAWTGSAAKAL